jgi:hypothetical protein
MVSIRCGRRISTRWARFSSAVSRVPMPWVMISTMDRSLKVEPIGPPNQLVVAVAYERILFAAIQWRLIKLGHLDIVVIAQRLRSHRVRFETCLRDSEPAGPSSARPLAIG